MKRFVCVYNIRVRVDCNNELFFIEIIDSKSYFCDVHILFLKQYINGIILSTFHITKTCS